MMLNRLMLKQALLVVLFFLVGSVCADEVNKMTIIDDQANQITIEDFEFERLDSKDSTTSWLGKLQCLLQGWPLRHWLW